ncbi:ABC transporter ATP-binding protein [Mesorhizobium sp. M7A.F.Ca.CA.001.07.2.1]|uniref:ABC transporter ATP-binding protein n=1 Tax=Mesorhizobium TaxID=68287 RepID=UPI000FCAC13B|nr:MULTISPECIES: ABC transporter ATP-binding protein [Mesorhizobium]RVB32077.1 ABC transporter ATP-binding protein [Mesorhizobium sp. M7A.F.Ca.CA.004.05.1.1]MCF6122671.1 ABC transporter ATP-binding protein [Mesorhizobium ciceri]MCQ8813135.1 ABC transporter ATP-binding protein [Mesorhizobium sp. SEMIA396]RUX75378.1 ABC transporter ATP-binding protein [Mesorhizobium sp. M7A.F.Ca.CA.004.08.2.1]RUX88858.1 ABC transporter ATP-binding protein [Mesorhizobium sp. M7A.F.Ca.CA.004.08.1.1]
MAPDPLVRLQAVSKIFPGGIVGLDAVDLDIISGEFVTLLGPSGCGKTTSLRVIAGFESPSSGKVLLDGRDITALRPFDRPVNTVFQDYALFPHMNVAENVGFGLSLRKLSGAEQAKRTGEALDMVGLADKLGARVSELSGGQRQRVALARAIVCEPRVLLLDEPLSALDAHLREQMQVELKRLQSRLGTTFVMVTHDQTEALSISDRIVVMNKGRIEQIAPPATLYDRPATKFVASFIGTMNLLQSRFVGRDGDRLRFAAGALPLEAISETSEAPAEGATRTIGVRPEDLLAMTEAAPGTAPARVNSVVFHGRTLRLHAELGQGAPVVIDAPRQAEGSQFSVGDVAHISLRRGANCPVLPS